MIPNVVAERNRLAGALLKPRLTAFLWAFTAWIDIGTAIMAYATAGYTSELTIGKALHILWLCIGLGHWVKGMISFTYAITGVTVSEWNVYFIRIDNRPLLKCALGLVAFAILILYCLSSVFGGLPYLLIFGHK